MLDLEALKTAIPFYIGGVFMVTTLITYIILNHALKQATTSSRGISRLLVLWLGLQGILALKGFYIDLQSEIPKFPLLVLPALVLIALVFITKEGRSFIDKLPLEHLTYIHVIRIPVEIVLFWLFIEKQIPEIMTFEGRNFDILSGISAPIIGYLYFTKKVINKNILLVWNFVCLALLFNIVITAILSIPTPFQKFGFEQPNIAVLKFPMVWLPSFVVPVVLFSHLVSIQKLLKS